MRIGHRRIVPPSATIRDPWYELRSHVRTPRPDATSMRDGAAAIAAASRAGRGAGVAGRGAAGRDHRRAAAPAARVAAARRPTRAGRRRRRCSTRASTSRRARSRSARPRATSSRGRALRPPPRLAGRGARRAPLVRRLRQRRRRHRRRPLADGRAWRSSPAARSCASAAARRPRRLPRARRRRRASRCRSARARPSASPGSRSAAASVASCAATGSTADSLRARHARARRRPGRALLRRAAQPDLFWALRGGGAGFGDRHRAALRRRSPPADPLALHADVPVGAAPARRSTRGSARCPAPGASSPTAASARCSIPDGAPDGHRRPVTGTAPRPRCARCCAPLLAARARARQTIRRRAFVDAALPDAARRDRGRRVTADRPALPELPALGLLRRAAARGRDRGAARADRGWPGRGGTGHEGGVQLDALGAAVNRPPPGATAFVHRTHRFHCAYLSFWGAATRPTAPPRARSGPATPTP